MSNLDPEYTLEERNTRALENIESALSDVVARLFDILEELQAIHRAVQ